MAALVFVVVGKRENSSFGDSLSRTRFDDSMEEMKKKKKKLWGTHF